MVNPRILVHLGASEVPEQFQAQSLEYVVRAVQKGKELALAGAKAEDIVPEVISVLEDCPCSDAGIGAVFNGESNHQMDAGIMTGDRRYGALMSLHNIKNPIKAARLLVNDDHYSIICGEGAMKFATEHGIPTLSDEEFTTEYNTYYKNLYSDPLDLFVKPGAEHGTVGCVCMDTYGNIAAGTSTGGTPFSPKGRVGDSPICGCGVYADDDSGCVSCTGYGEAIIVNLLAARTADRMVDQPPMEAAKMSIEKFSKTPRAVGGVICISKKTSDYGLYFNTKHMPFAMLMDDGTIKSGMVLSDIPSE